MENVTIDMSDVSKEFLEHILGKNIGLPETINPDEPLKNINKDIINYTESYLSLFNKYVEFQLKEIERDMENIKNVIECQLDIPV
jgi:hypothetical protein